MLRFGEHRWILLREVSRFEAHIFPQHQKAQDVLWQLNFRYFAGGARWRRVEYYRRPSVWIELGGFDGSGRFWTDLAHRSYWADEGSEADARRAWGRSGFLEVDYFPKCGEEGAKHYDLAFGWSIGEREDRLLTVELAAMTSETAALEPPLRPSAVTADGAEEEAPELDKEFWKERADLYVIEQIPFGRVSVAVPRNVRDPEAFALSRARHLIGVGEPEHIEVTDRATRKGANEGLNGDIDVELHFHGHYEH